MKRNETEKQDFIFRNQYHKHAAAIGQKATQQTKSM